MKKNYKFKSKVLVYPGAGGWRFLVLPKKESEKIRADFRHLERGWASHRVKVKVGKSNWQTSIFYDRRSGAYLLPLKKEIRKREEIFDDDQVSFSIEIK